MSDIQSNLSPTPQSHIELSPQEEHTFHLYYEYAQDQYDQHRQYGIPDAASLDQNIASMAHYAYGHAEILAEAKEAGGHTPLADLEPSSRTVSLLATYMVQGAVRDPGIKQDLGLNASAVLAQEPLLSEDEQHALEMVVNNVEQIWQDDRLDVMKFGMVAQLLSYVIGQTPQDQPALRAAISAYAAGATMANASTSSLFIGEIKSLVKP